MVVCKASKAGYMYNKKENRLLITIKTNTKLHALIYKETNNCNYKTHKYNQFMS